MVLGFPTIESPGELFTKRAPVNSIKMKHSGMRRQARPDRRNCMIFGPIDEFCQGCPIRLIRQCRGARLCPSHDQTIYVTRPQLTNVLIAVRDQGTIPVLAWELWQIEQSQTNGNISRC